MKGLTLLWMCLCCLRPEDVANVLPHSEQAWARAPTCCERMCLCRLLGSVNTCWGGNHTNTRGRYYVLLQTWHRRWSEPSEVITLPLSSFHIRSVCHCRATSDVGWGLISSWKPWGTGHTYIPSPQSGTEHGPPDCRAMKTVRTPRCMRTSELYHMRL